MSHFSCNGQGSFEHFECFVALTLHEFTKRLRTKATLDWLHGCDRLSCIRMQYFLRVVCVMSKTIRQFARKVLLNNKEEINANFNMKKEKKNFKKFRKKIQGIFIEKYKKKLKSVVCWIQHEANCFAL